MAMDLSQPDPSLLASPNGRRSPTRSRDAHWVGCGPCRSSVSNVIAWLRRLGGHSLSKSFARPSKAFHAEEGFPDLGSRQVLAVLAIYGSFNTDGLKTLPITGPTLSRNLGLITLKEREPTPAAIGISTLIRSAWSTSRGLIRFKQQ